ncbi:retrovirus-related Pol polyprotein from transposon 412 [Trichonephila clavipes]|nr:retrovirus-related Pol polyprotein from transposon 412 [Trichonephila clavipes]
MISLEYFVDGLMDEEIQMTVRMADVKDPKSALLYALKVEATTQASCINHHSIREARVTLDAPSVETSPLSILQRSVTGLFGTLHLRNGVLYRKWESDDGKTFRWQLILPKTRVSTVLKELHGSPTGGHFGVMKTLQKVRERFYWNNVRSDVGKCCRTCDPCAARKGPRKRTRGRLQLYNVGMLFERIAFDILGPLPRSSDDNNNILVVMDYFTKWPEAYPIPDQEASTVAEVLVQQWISRFGVPLQLHSDQGRNFDSAVCKRLQNTRHRQNQDNSFASSV